MLMLASTPVIFSFTPAAVAASAHKHGVDTPRPKGAGKLLRGSAISLRYPTVGRLTPLSATPEAWFLPSTLLD